MKEATIFEYHKIVEDKLLAYGFNYENGVYQYATNILHGQFCLLVEITKDSIVSSKLLDTDFNEEYVLHHVTKSVGTFTAKVKEAYETVMLDILAKCFTVAVFQSEQAQQIVAYVQAKYGDEVEFLWKKSPKNGILRRKDTEKWYAAILSVSQSKIGFTTNEKVEIIDLRIQPEKIDDLIDGVHYLPGYHMNKKSWYTICLDGSLSIAEIESRIDESYLLAIK